jgi:hypothetical protein
MKRLGCDIALTDRNMKLLGSDIALTDRNMSFW